MIKFQIRGVKEVQEFMRTVPRGAFKAGFRAFSLYILGDNRHGLRHDEAYKFVSRADAYRSTGATFENGNPVPDGYFSAKQFRYVAALTKGFTEFPPRKTPTDQAQAWAYTETKDGYAGAFVNEQESAYFTRSETGQARQPAAVGWRKVSAVIADNMAGAMRSGRAAIRKFLTSRK